VKSWYPTIKEREVRLPKLSTSSDRAYLEQHLLIYIDRHNRVYGYNWESGDELWNFHLDFKAYSISTAYANGNLMLWSDESLYWVEFTRKCSNEPLQIIGYGSKLWNDMTVDRPNMISNIESILGGTVKCVQFISQKGVRFWCFHNSVTKEDQLFQMLDSAAKKTTNMFTFATKKKELKSPSANVSAIFVKEAKNRNDKWEFCNTDKQDLLKYLQEKESQCTIS
jgi:hypothetical protein